MVSFSAFQERREEERERERESSRIKYKSESFRDLHTRTRVSNLYWTGLLAFYRTLQRLQTPL